MIVRTCFKCTTCGHPHIVRIGLGQEEYQSHRFPCVNCGEDMAVGIHVSYAEVSTRPEAVENAELIREVPGATVVNVDANFIVPEEQRHLDMAFPRIHQSFTMARRAEELGTLVETASIPERLRGSRPFRRPDFHGEWKLLKKAWSLYRRGKFRLADKQVEIGSREYYAADPLSDVPDWLWRFTLFLGQPMSEPLFLAVFAQIERAMPQPGFGAFIQEYQTHLAPERSARYFDLMKEYFSGYHEFGQVYFHVVRELEIPTEHVASSADFNAVRMFYGNAYEIFTSSVDVLAYVNNLLMGRPFDEFTALTRADYLKLDKSARFGPFSINAPFQAICRERDNQLRNASHHGGIRFCPETQTLTFRVGKGGTGHEQHLPYVNYLERCTKLFLQSMILLRAELLMCKIAGASFPI